MPFHQIGAEKSVSFQVDFEMVSNMHRGSNNGRQQHLVNRFVQSTLHLSSAIRIHADKSI